MSADRETLMGLADKFDAKALSLARPVADAGSMIQVAHVANLFAVAASLRAIASKGQDHEG
jgi:hypothetical protein